MGNKALIIGASSDFGAELAVLHAAMGEAIARSKARSVALIDGRLSFPAAMRDQASFRVRVRVR